MTKKYQARNPLSEYSGLPPADRWNKLDLYMANHILADMEEWLDFIPANTMQSWIDNVNDDRVSLIKAIDLLKKGRAIEYAIDEDGWYFAEVTNCPS